MKFYKRKRIIETWMNEVHEKGFKQFSVKEVKSHTGVNEYSCYCDPGNSV